MKITGMLLIITAVLCTLAAPAHADIIYSNLGSGFTYQCCSALEVDFDHSFAVPFAVPVGPGFDLNQIGVAVTSKSGNGVTIELLSDSPAGLPGAVIQSWTLSTLPSYGSANTIEAGQTILGISGITLSGGTLYWLAVLPANSGSVDEWSPNTIGPTGTIAQSLDGGAFWSQVNYLSPGAFELSGTPVSVSPVSTTPEPNTMVLLATGLAGLLGMGLHRKRLA